MYFNNLDGIRIGFLVYSDSNRFHYKTNMDGIQTEYVDIWMVSNFVISIIKMVSIH